MKVLTLHPIWAWLVIHGPKRIENRTWRTTHRGPLAIHAGKTQPDEGALRLWLAEQGVVVPDPLPRSCILGTVNVVDVVPLAEVAGQPFAEGPWCWMLTDPKPFSPPIACRGRQMLWGHDLPE